MPPFQAPDSQHVHHHGPLAGMSAGAMAALAGAGIILLACRHQLAEVASVVAWVLMIAVPLAALAALVYAFLWLRHRALHPETLARPAPARAVVTGDTPAAVPGARPAGELSAPGSHTHYHFDSAEAVEAALQAMQERQITEGHHDPA